MAGGADRMDLPQEDGADSEHVRPARGAPIQCKVPVTHAPQLLWPSQPLCPPSSHVTLWELPSRPLGPSRPKVQILISSQTGVNGHRMNLDVFNTDSYCSRSIN